MKLLLTTIAVVLVVGCGPPARNIWQAAYEGNIETVKQHLANGVDVNARGGIGETPLYDAVLGGHKEIIELLIAEGADVNAKDDWGKTPLRCAAVQDQKEIAEMLIAKGADVNTGTPLHSAAEYGRKEIAELLIANGADVNAKDDKGRTPLDRGFGYTETADLLRKHGGKTGEELKAEGK